MAAVLPFLPAITQFANQLIDRIWPDKIAQAAQRAAALQHVQDLAAQQYGQLLTATSASDAAQAPVNTAEAQSQSFWKSGARPAVIWICALALFSDFLVRPYMIAFLPAHAPPRLDMDTLLFLVSGLLGLGTLRSVDKWKGVA